MGRDRVVLVAVLAGCSTGNASVEDEGMPRTDGGARVVQDASFGCREGIRLCFGREVKVCSDGVYEVVEQCEEACRGGHCLDGQSSCSILDDLDAPGTCDAQAPPDSFDPVLEWSWDGPFGADSHGRGIQAMPLVANLTDDNGDGSINVCDTPDVLVVGRSRRRSGGDDHSFIAVFDGASGTRHDLPFEGHFQWTVTPAIGDVDNDGLPEVVVAGGLGRNDRFWMVFEHDGSGPRVGPVFGGGNGGGNAIALADLDNDGDVEMMSCGNVVNHELEVVFEFACEGGSQWNTPIAVDLDGDRDLEVVIGPRAYHHDGSLAYEASGVTGGFPAVADLDADGLPEIVLTGSMGVSILENDGTVTVRDARPVDIQHPESIWWTAWSRPSTIHDFDGDGQPEIGIAASNSFLVLEPTMELRWRASIQDTSGAASSTAFDFLGDGSAEAIYGDERHAHVFDYRGRQLMRVPRYSGTTIEYPVVADVDNDGSAEFVVVSNAGLGDDAFPMLQVYGDREDRWIQARRIWNQHSYHITNVREDGTIPRFESPSWERFNTFRSNAQLSATGGACRPEPEPVPLI